GGWPSFSSEAIRGPPHEAVPGSAPTPTARPLRRERGLRRRSPGRISRVSSALDVPSRLPRRRRSAREETPAAYQSTRQGPSSPPGASDDLSSFYPDRQH